jgi:ABC-type transport system involved in cytochrome c biogenesis permease component
VTKPDRVTARARAATEPHDALVNAWLMRASWRQLSIVMAALICPFFVLLFRLGGDESWAAALIMGVGVAVVCGPVLGYLTAHEMQKSMAASGPLTEDDRVLVERATRRGPVPEDGALREAALRVTEDRLLVLRQTRAGALAFASVLVLVTGFFAIAQSAWWWIAVVACAALLVLVVIGPARLQRRAALLRSTDR